MRSQAGRLIWVCLGLALAAVADAAPWPNPPRNGPHSVQAIFGGRDVIPLCIEPPRTFEDGSPIPDGTLCTIVVYRSRSEGKPGTYTEEVGRGTGPIEREWIDVGARVPADSPQGGVIYLASCAIVNGEMSDLNNQYLTIIWSPGQFSVKEYPAAGSKPGAPPGRKPRPEPEVYPEWLRALGALTRSDSAPAGGGGAYTILTPPLRELNPEFDTDIRLQMTLTADATGALSGSTDLDPWLAVLRQDQLVKKIELMRNDIEGTLIGGTLKGVATINLAIHAAMGNQTAVGKLSAITSLNGSTTTGGGPLSGQASTEMSLVINAEPPLSLRKDWPFTMASGGEAAGRRFLLAPDSLGPVLPAPGLGFETGASNAGGGIIGTEFQKSIVGTVELDVGGTHFFSLAGRRPNTYLDPKTGRWISLSSSPQSLPEAPQWYVGPSDVLQGTPVGDGVRVQAVGPGMGEVWARSSWEATLADGTPLRGYLVSIWVVPVGADARAKVAQSRIGGGGGPLPPYTGPVVSRAVISGRAVLKSTGAGVSGAQIFLWLEPEGVYHKPDWVTGPGGSFRITADGSLPNGGLIPGRYEVMIQWRPSGATVGAGVTADNTRTWVDDDLWPCKRHMVTINSETAQKEIVVGEICLVPLKEMDWSQRE